MPCVDRRSVIVGGVAVAASAALSSCSSQPVVVSDEPPAAPPTDTPRSARTTGTPIAEQPLASISDVLEQQPLQVNDPASGAEAYLVRKGDDVVMRAASCTHQGCIVAWSAVDRLLRCPCHGATYDAWTGEVMSGPAASPLREIPTTVRAAQIYRT